MGLPLSVCRGDRDPGARWAETDWMLAQALTYLERHTCPECNTPLTQAYDPDLERKWQAELPIRCHPCTAIALRAKQYADSDTPQALRFPVRLRTRP